LLNELPPPAWIWVLAGYFLLTLPLWPAWNWMFPKVWLLAALFLLAGWPFLRAIPPSPAVTSFLCCVLLSGAIAIMAVRASAEEPRKRFAPVVSERGSIYSGSPASSPAGFLYESIGTEKYVIRRGPQMFSFNGDAFHPSAPDTGGSIYLELVKGQGSAIMRFDEVTGDAIRLPISVPNPQEPTVSHDGRSIAFVSGGALFIFDGYRTRRVSARGHDPSFVPGDNELVFAAEGKLCSISTVELASGRSTALMQDSSDLASPSVSPDGRYLLFAARRNVNWQVWVREILSGREKEITGGNCNNFSPVWDGSREIVFASDCRRGLGLSALFRAALQ
jgi:Tol biopolymer transport system component